MGTAASASTLLKIFFSSCVCPIIIMEVLCESASKRVQKNIYVYNICTVLKVRCQLWLWGCSSPVVTPA